jgi:signal transduction histidine kinase
MDNTMLDRLVLFTLCFAVYAPDAKGFYVVVPVLVALTAGAFCGYIQKNPLNLAIFTGFAVVCLFYSPLLLFLPVIGYEVPRERQKWLGLAFFPAAAALSQSRITEGCLTLVMIVVGALLRYRTETLKSLKTEYNQLSDSTKELSLRLNEKNRGLMEKQDYEISVATLNERNRIARDIHDGVGHLLSSAILQVGALIAVSRDIELKNRLEAIKNTLSQAMDSIRTSVHELYDESIDLYAEISKIIQKFTFCPVNLNYHMESEPGRKIKYAFIAVTSEALANAARHSNATAVSITVQEHPALYQLVVKDNGSAVLSKTADEKGIGLSNIADRVANLGGILNISRENGFKIFITVPKERSEG